MLPSPIDVLNAFIKDFAILMNHSRVSLLEAFLGLFLGIILAFVLSVVMDRFNFLYKSFYPLIVITQTVPVIAIAPLMVLWMGYGIAPKVALIVIVCFFPILIALLDGYKTADIDAINLLKVMGANELQIFVNLKLPSSLPSFFAGLKIAVSYSIVGAVISEWLGSATGIGLGVYMTRVRKSYAFDKMFAVIFLITIISLLLIELVKFIEKKSMPWKKYKI